MAKIINATDYGFRKVIRVCLNPDDPEWVHDDGTAHPAANVNGCDGVGNTYYCHYNWKVQEFVWTGEELYTRDTAGGRLPKTDAQLLAEISVQIPQATAASEITQLVGSQI